MFNKYPSTENFHNFVKTYKGKKTFIGLDEGNNPIFEIPELQPVELVGTIKLHGTNAGVTLNDREIYVQKRTDSLPLDITKGDTHFGFMNFAHSNQQWFKDLRSQIVNKFNLSSDEPITIFGEWCGPRIQKGVAISQIPDKKFFVFGIQLPNTGQWLNLSDIPYNVYSERIWFITMFKTYKLNANFNDVATLSQQLETITLEVENECPVAKEFGVSGIGEGLVWSGVDDRGNFVRFKTKGKKHSKPSRTPKSESENSINPAIAKFIESVDIVNRCQQCYHSEFENEVPDKSKTGIVLNWVFKDIINEEYHLLNELGLEVADVKPSLMESIRSVFFEDIIKSL
jgi:hypothetical protein